MGTNYYAREEICNRCGHAKKESHIGKSSAGWTFSFHALDDIKSANEWFMFLSQKDVKIFDEYDIEVSYTDFVDLVLSKKKEKYSHAIEHPEGNFVDKHGYSFTEGEFC